MTALSGGEQLDDEPSPLDSVLERSDAGDAPRVPRSLDEIFPLRGDATRGGQMQATWRAFGSEMEGAVRAALDTSRSPPEIAYAIGGIVHNYFRTRGVTLTSYELRRLVAELLALRQRAERCCRRWWPSQPPAAETSWTGAEPGTPGPVVPDVVFEGPPSPLVDVVPRDDDAALLAAVTAKARARLATTPEGRFPREAAATAIDAALGELFQGEPDKRDRLARLALSELCGLGPIDLIWADRSIRAVFVNGPAAIFVERNGVLEPSSERFLDQAHLAELVGRLVRPSSGAVPFRLRDGGEGMVIFPPAAPAGPVLVLRRGEPGNATFERLIAAGTLDRSMADLLRIAARCRLNMLVVGPEGSGKTALLASLARDLSDTRVVPAPIFVHEDGRFHRRTTAPSFAGLVHKAGYGAALSSALR